MNISTEDSLVSMFFTALNIEDGVLLLWVTEITTLSYARMEIFLFCCCYWGRRIKKIHEIYYKYRAV